MKNCNLLNRIVPRAYQSPRNFTNGSAESLGTKLLYGHAGTIGKPVIARRNNHRLCALAQPQESFFHNQPRVARGKRFCVSLGVGYLPAARMNSPSCGEACESSEEKWGRRGSPWKSVPAVLPN